MNPKHGVPKLMTLWSKFFHVRLLQWALYAKSFGKFYFFMFYSRDGEWECRTKSVAGGTHEEVRENQRKLDNETPLSLYIYTAVKSVSK